MSLCVDVYMCVPVYVYVHTDRATFHWALFALFEAGPWHSSGQAQGAPNGFSIYGGLGFRGSGFRA